MTLSSRPAIASGQERSRTASSRWVVRALCLVAGSLARLPVLTRPLQHDKVAAAAVVGKPDKERGELVKAFVVLSDKTKAPENKQEEEALIAEIQAFVKTRLAHYEYPREIEFIRELPTTTTGKVIRKALKQKEIQKQQQQELDKSSSK